jgi:hypothetical protein
MGCSPYFAVTGAHPILPFDIFEATYLQPAPTSILLSTDLIVQRAIALQKRSKDINHIYSKVYKGRLKAAIRFEKQHTIMIRNFYFHRGDLVLMRNTQIEKSLKRPRYVGPLIVLLLNYGGAYILCKLDRTVLHRPIGAFRVIPYFPQKSIDLPDNFIDINTAQLRKMEETKDVDDDDDDKEDEKEFEDQIDD